MEIDVGAKLRVRQPTSEIMNWCKQNLVLDNPDYHKKVRLGKWTGNTPRHIVLYETIGTELLLPFGCLKSVWGLGKTEDVFKPVFNPFRRFNYKSNINLYRYQENAVEAILRAKNGVVVMPCGAGKTQTALEAVARLGGRTLWLTHTKDLMTQSLTRAKAVFDADANCYGTITGGKVDIRDGITFATVQTMSKIDLTQYRDAFDVVIVDECHHAIGSPTKVMQFYKVLSHLSARYKIGLTATPKRADGLERSMYALLGGIICEISKDEVKHTTCPVEVRRLKTDWVPDYDYVLAGDGTINYASLVDDLVHSETRFKMVLDAIQALPKAPTLVLANRVEYLQKMCDSYQGKAICLSTLGASKKAKEERKTALKALNDGELDCIFATYLLAKEGLDCPNLRYLILATPEKDETTVVQAVGRVARKAEGKDVGVVLDFIDNFGMYQGWAKKRLGFYKKNSYSCIDI